MRGITKLQNYLGGQISGLDNYNRWVMKQRKVTFAELETIIAKERIYGLYIAPQYEKARGDYLVAIQHNPKQFMFYRISQLEGFHLTFSRQFKLPYRVYRLKLSTLFKQYWNKEDENRIKQ